MFDIDFPEFVPHRLVRGGNAQTILGSFLQGLVEPDNTVLHYAETSFGDRLALHQNKPKATRESIRQVLLLHGLGGCHASSYMIRVSRRLVQSGFGTWRLDARGSGAGVALARHHHHASRVEDVQAAINYILERFPQSKITIVGFSLGANVLLKWLEQGTGNRDADSAIAIAPPANLFHCSANLNTGLSRGYDKYFAKMMMSRLLERRRVRPDMLDVPIQGTPESLRQFDSQFTAPAGGFSDLEDYYRTSSSIDGLQSITTPTLLMIDESDPVIPVEMFDNVRLSRSTQIIRTRGGGHLGYIAQRGIDPDRHWLDWRVVQVVRNFDDHLAR